MQNFNDFINKHINEKDKVEVLKIDDQGIDFQINKTKIITLQDINAEFEQVTEKDKVEVLKVNEQEIDVQINKTKIITLKDINVEFEQVTEKDKIEVLKIDEQHIDLKITKTELVTLEFESEDINAEFEQVIWVGKYAILTKDDLTLFVYDSLGEIKSEILLENEDIKVILTKELGDEILALNCFKDIIDFDKINKEKVYYSELLKDGIIKVYIELKHEGIKIANDFDVQKFINSILSNISLNYGIILDSPYNIIDIMDNEKLINVELKLTNDFEPILYFLEGERSKIPHFKYLEYYHVMEYYFLHHKIKQIDSLIKELIYINKIDRDIGQKESYYYKLANLYKHYSQEADEKELPQLQYLIREDIGFLYLIDILKNNYDDIEFIKRPIFSINDSAVQISYICNDKRGKSFKDLSEITIGDREQFCNSVANRIYKIRNSIVHTKKFEKDNIFVPNSENFKALYNDLKLIRLLAYTLTK